LDRRSPAEACHRQRGASRSDLNLANIPDLQEIYPNNGNFPAKNQTGAGENPGDCGRNGNWHGSCNLPGIKAGWFGPSHVREYIMFAKLQNVAFALTGALLVSALFIGAAVPVTPIA
jgi:hypothetical protein